MVKQNNAQLLRSFTMTAFEKKCPNNNWNKSQFKVTTGKKSEKNKDTAYKATF